MPFKIKMDTNLSNSYKNFQYNNISSKNNSNIALGTGTTNTNLSTSMIGRIHYSKPGCSSCGH